MDADISNNVDNVITSPPDAIAPKDSGFNWYPIIVYLVVALILCIINLIYTYATTEEIPFIKIICDGLCMFICVLIIYFLCNFIGPTAGWLCVACLLICSITGMGLAIAGSGYAKYFDSSTLATGTTTTTTETTTETTTVTVDPNDATTA